ncbi:MAG: NUDIX domain-containing protein [Bacteroidaceae bacterium]|nr:NUDIX domain-containing protein [Bacteroidaceae bacterium]
MDFQQLFKHCPRCGSPHFETHNAKSKRCEACGFVYYLNPSASTVAVIINERDELLVVRRAKEPARGTLDLPGGFSDMGETSEEGVAREVMEETGLRVTRVEFLFSQPNVYRYSDLDIPTLDMFYRCEVAATEGARGMDDAAEVMWLPLSAVNPADFGLRSISIGVGRLLGKNMK